MKWALLWASWAWWAVLGQSLANQEQSFCSNYEASCSDCIQKAQCQWCSTPTNSSVSQHCFSSTEDLSAVCEDVENPQTEVKVSRNDPLSEFQKGDKIPDLNNIIQFRPQQFKLKLRPGKPVNITLTFRQVPDYPLDLYYLMDLSQSMEKHKDTLADVGRKLASTMRKLTSQFKIGFGSFVDKVLLPFVDTNPQSLRNPCQKKKCASPFSFINNLALTEDDQQFETQVKAAEISANLDSPEGGFDALMQAMVCQQEIGWRKQVRKIIVFSTDAQFHSAGDGKLAGVIEPNDGKCHLEGGRSYEKYDQFDYPSISHINEVAKAHGVNIIFAVKGNEHLYKQLQKNIDGASYATLSRDSQNIIEVIENVYNSITGRVEIEERSSSFENLFALRFFSDCPNREAGSNTALACSNVKEGEKFTVTVQVELKECPKVMTDRRAEIRFGTKEETVLLNVEMMCDCECEQQTGQPLSTRCGGKGSIKCGICECTTGFFGDNCECEKNSTSSGSSDALDTDCKPPNSAPDAAVCSGKGSCSCKKCSCWEDYYGKFCQWNRAKCRERDTAQLCSGHGTCDREKCSCDYDWEGDYCEYKHRRACIAKGDTVGCSGNGDCIRGKCSCNIRGDIIYTGEFCEDCPSCGSGKCSEFRPCVQCRKWQSGSYDNAQCDRNCSQFKYQNQESLEGALQDGARLCTFTDSLTNCDFNFTYKYISQANYQIFAQRRQTCYQVDVLAAVFGVIGAIVGLGILTLCIWKIATSIHDSREYSRFLLEFESQKWATTKSPLYNSPTTEVSNPAYGS